MKSIVNIPKVLTHGEDLVVIRKSDYEVLQRRLEEYKDAFGKIKRGEAEFKNGKTKVIKSLSELR